MPNNTDAIPRFSPTVNGYPAVGTDGATPVVTTRQGTVRGVVENGIAVFRGIPYAEAPVGARRFKPPVRVARWEGVRDARRFGDICPQTDESPIDSASLPRGVPQGDDCLNLNVWTPSPGSRHCPCSCGFTAAASSGDPDRSPCTTDRRSRATAWSRSR